MAYLGNHAAVGVTSFAVDVYEFHARLALTEGDLHEYNQCQTQLIELYDSGLHGAHNEFAAYRILYLQLQACCANVRVPH